MAEPTPACSHAIVVAIEQYAADWDLDGPASDAVRFLEYLSRCGVPKTNVTACLAPLPANEALSVKATALAATVIKPTQAAIDDLIELQLRTLNTELLLFFWGGHGVITPKDERRLYTADATTKVKRNLDLNALMEALRTEHYPKIPRQALIIDTCANYVPQATANLTHRTYPVGNGVAGRAQFAIYAASSGEYAKNVTAEKTGLMSRELMTALNARGTGWPPDFTALADELASRFIELRQQGKSRQTPATFWFRSPQRGGQFLSKFAVEPAATATPGPTHRLPVDQFSRLVTAFLEVDSMFDGSGRTAIVRRLRPEVATTIRRDAHPRVDVAAIIDRCRIYNALPELLDCIEQFETRSPPMERLRSLADELLPDEVPKTPD